MSTVAAIPIPVPPMATPAQSTTASVNTVATTLAQLLALELATGKRKRPATHFGGIPIACTLATSYPLVNGDKREFRTPRRLAHIEPVALDKEEDDTDDEQPNGGDDDDDDDDDIKIIW